MDAAAAPTLFTGSGASYTTIQADGYARWYQVGDAAGKTMTVQVPENSGFWVYDGNGQVTASSVLWATPPSPCRRWNDCLAGDPGARFHLRFRITSSGHNAPQKRRVFSGPNETRPEAGCRAVRGCEHFKDRRVGHSTRGSARPQPAPGLHRLDDGVHLIGVQAYIES